MKRLITLLALSTALGVAACDGLNRGGSEAADVAMETSIAPAADDAGVPVADPGAVDAPPADSTTLPSEKRSSEESVQPESETLFY